MSAKYPELSELSPSVPAEVKFSLYAWIELAHNSIADLNLNSLSFMIVIVQGSNVLSPAIFNTLPLKGTSITPICELGRFAARTVNLPKFTRSESCIISLGNAKSTWNRLGLAKSDLTFALN